MAYDPREQEEIIAAIVAFIRPVLADGGRKRRAGRKPHWSEDIHLPSFYRHLRAFELGVTEDEDSGAHPSAHASVRLAMEGIKEVIRLQREGRCPRAYEGVDFGGRRP